MTRRFASILLLLALVSAPASSVRADDWPQWRGPDRNGISKEKGLLNEWPKAGPQSLWEISGLGAGYGTVAIQGDRIFVQGTEGKTSLVFCLSRTDGKAIWKTEMGPALPRSKGDGPRSTPTVEGDLLYALTDNGDLACLKTSDGSKVWGLNILTEFKAENPGWSISESPLIDGDRLIVSPGGKGAGIVALDKKTGKTVWTSKALSDQAAYSSCIVANVGDVRAIMNFTSKGGVGVRADNGDLLWSYPKPANGTANCTTPVFRDNKVFYSSAYGTGCGLLKLEPSGGKVNTTEVYFNKNMQNHHGGVVLVGDYLYGFSDHILKCIKFDTGEEVWKNRSVGKGSLTYADGKLFMLGEGNVVGLAEATPEGYRELGRFPIKDQGEASWAHPVVSGGRLYIRNQGILACYDVRGDGGKEPAAKTPIN